MSVVACIFAGWSWSKPAARTIGSDEDGAGDGHAVPQHGLVGVAAASARAAAGSRAATAPSSGQHHDRQEDCIMDSLMSFTAAHAPDGDEDGGDAGPRCRRAAR